MNEILENHRKLAEKLPRISGKPIVTKEDFELQLLFVTLDIGDMLEEAKKKEDPYWWRFQDLLDDLHNLRESVVLK